MRNLNFLINTFITDIEELQNYATPAALVKIMAGFKFKEKKANKTDN